MKNTLTTILVLLIFFGGPFYVLLSGKIVLNKHWRIADRSSANLAPKPSLNKKAIVQIYAARAYSWRGMFAVHTWIVVKEENEDTYTLFQGLGWNAFRKKPIVDIKKDIPDRIWFEHKPWILFEIRGDQAKIIIPKIKQLAKEYPYQNKYRLWPGPNSNTFTAYIVRHILSIKIRLPVTAIGKDYLQNNAICSKAPSKTGIQCSIKGLFGFILAKKEGFEINLLGLAFSLNTEKPFIHLPGVD